MSNLNESFDVLYGLPPNGHSALTKNFTQKTGESPELTEGMVAEVEDAAGSPVITKHTSGTAGVTEARDYPWLVIQGADQIDAQEASDNLACVSLRSGVIFKVETAVSFSVGDLVYANAGVFDEATAGNTKQACGQVIAVDSTAGTVTIAGS